MTTREKILETALTLFNQEGLPNVSLRNISEKLGISPGNLTYHFKKKEELEEALYFELVEKMNTEITLLQQQELNFEFLALFSAQLFDNFYTYRFIFIDIVHLTRNNIKIKNHYQNLLQIRKTQFLELIKILIEKGVLRTENTINEYSDLYTRIQVFSDYYISSQILLGINNPKEMKKMFVYHLNQMTLFYKKNP